MDNLDFARHDDYRPGLTAEERAAIEAFPVEKIQKVPTGESGDPFYLKWVPSTKVENNDGLSGGQIRMFHKETHERITKYQKAVILKGGRKRKPPHKEWRGQQYADQVREMAAAGMIDREIAEKLGYAETTICEWRRRLGIAPGLRKRQTSAEKVLDVTGEWIGTGAIGERLGISRNYANHCCGKLVKAGKLAQRKSATRGEFEYRKC